MECPGCGHPNVSDAAFCDECGARLDAACPACGETNRLGAKFCRKCGDALPRVGGRGRAAPPPTPIHLAEKILTARGALEGERKQVTVLFADIKGSLELLEGRDPEEVRKLLDPALQAMMDAVHRYEGTVNQILGDGIMALFGAPLAHEDHAVRACYAALAMQAAIGRYTETVRRSHGIEIQVRIGINSGEVVVRAIGNDLHMDYTAIGQTTHLAARMEQMAMPGRTRLTAETLRLAEGFVQVHPLGPVPVKGLPEPVPVFELTGVGATRTRLQVSAARGLTPFVGRRAEIDLLQEALERAGAGQGQVVALVGEAGVGKSRLFWEFTHSHLTQGWLVLESGSVSYGKATAYLPIIDLLKSYFQIVDRDDPRTIREKITGKLVTLDSALQAALPAFLLLFDVPGEEREWQTLEPAQRRQATLAALKRLLLRESQVQPLLLVFEDLHWIDSESQALLDDLVESLPTSPLLLLLSYRPEYRHGWSNKSYYRQRRVDPLSGDDAGELLATVLGRDESLAALKRLLIERTEGNPFFLEESVRTLAETAALVGEPGAYRLAHPVEAIQMPPTVQAVLAARIDRLSPEEKRLLQSASVVGQDVPFAVLLAIADLPEDIVRRGLGRLQTAEFLYEASLFPDLEYTFRHAVTHEVAYAGLLHERRRELHARIVDVIERLYPDGRAEQIERLGIHALRGEVWVRAVSYLRQAGTTAFERSANREAVACFDKALEAAEHLPEGRERVEAAIDLRFDLRNALFPLGEQERIAHCLREAEALAESLADQPRLGRVHSYLTNYFLALGDHERALVSGQRALALAGALGDFGLQVTTSFHLGQIYASRGDYRRAASFNRAIVDAVEGDPTRAGFGGSPVLVLARAWLLWCLAEIGEFSQGLARGDGQLRTAQAVGQPFDLVTTRLGVGLLHLRRGDLEEAIAVLEPALPLCRDGNLTIWFAAIASPLGYAYALSGRSGEAIALLERAVGTASARGGGGHALRMAHLAEAYLLGGRVEEGAPLAARSLEIARERKERGHEAYALRLLAEVALGRDGGDVADGQRYYGEALAIAEDLGMRPLVGRCRLALGALYRRLGQPARAAAEIAAAIELFRALEMRAWLARADALTASGPSPRRSAKRGSARSR